MKAHINPILIELLTVVSKVVGYGTDSQSLTIGTAKQEFPLPPCPEKL
jgi:hypothetical protein